LGIDPGGNATVTVCEIDGFHRFGPLVEGDKMELDGMPHFKHYHFSSARYKFDSGVSKWMRRMEKEKQGIIQKLENDMPHRNVIGLKAISDYNKYVMQHLHEFVGFYANERYRYARFEHYIGKKRTISSLCKEIIAMEAPKGNRKTKVSVKNHRLEKWDQWKQNKEMEPERVIINFGAAKIGSMRHIRGSMKGPHKAVLDELNKMENVLVIMEDEFCTSQCCVACGKKSLEEVWTNGLSKCKCGENHIVVTKKEQKQVNSIQEALENMSRNRIHSIPASVSLSKPWELKMCANVECKARKWNRDVNAGAQMLTLLNHRIASMDAGNGCLSRPIGLQRKSSIQKETDTSNN